MTHSQIERNDIVDWYLAGKLQPQVQAEFEDHFLACPHCVERLEQDRRPVAAILEACVAERYQLEDREVWPVALQAWSLGAALAGVALLVTFGLRPAAPPRARIERSSPDRLPVVELAAYRAGGGAGSKIPVAVAGKPFLLKLDLRGLSPSEIYQVSIVTESGELVWSGTAAGTGGQWLEVPVRGARLGPGAFFVRLAGVREYALVVE
ncbi:MAG: hypothetical protein HY238_02640 [Acidobacteria bacterium]|nr:hypothetical protein [Acidobacteriota bacterium]